jgi:hypothetical protein
MYRPSFLGALAAGTIVTLFAGCASSAGNDDEHTGQSAANIVSTVPVPTVTGFPPPTTRRSPR